MSKDKTENNPPLCKHCGGEIAMRNPTGKCDHLYWPELLTAEAKLANGFKLVLKPVWVKLEEAK